MILSEFWVISSDFSTYTKATENAANRKIENERAILM